MPGSPVRRQRRHRNRYVIYLQHAQAEALEDPNVPITALQGKVFVADTAAKIDNLSPAQISTLALIGVNALTGSASES